MFDQLSERLNDPKVFGKAMELLKGYDDACKKGNYMEYIEDLDDTLEDGEYALFERVLSYRSEATFMSNSPMFFLLFWLKNAQSGKHDE